MRSLRDMLTNGYGLDLSEWTLLNAFSVSDNGLTITGDGINPSGYDEAWIVTLPEPTSLSLMALSVLVVIRRRQRHGSD